MLLPNKQKLQRKRRNLRDLMSNLPKSNILETEAVVAVAPEETIPSATVANPEVSQTEEVVVASLCSSATVEALLLASGEPLSYQRLSEILHAPKAEITAAVAVLKARYDLLESGIEIVNVSERLQLRTKAAHSGIVRQLLAVKPRRLSGAALETLSVIAYQQPIVKSEIDKIRGVDVAPTLKTLLERNLIKIIGYQASAGQPALYGTAEEFLRIFGLQRLDQLPSLKDLKTLAKEPGESGEAGELSDSESLSEDETQDLSCEVVANSDTPETVQNVSESV